MRVEVNGVKLRIQFRHEDGQWVRRTYLAEAGGDPRVIELARIHRQVRQAAAEPGVSDSELVLLHSIKSLVKQLGREIVNNSRSKNPVMTRKRTVCTILMEHGDHVHELVRGEAYVSPLDQFDRETGRQIALTRALVQLEEEEVRGQLLTAYLLRNGFGKSPAWDAMRSSEARELMADALPFVAEVAADRTTEKLGYEPEDREEIVKQNVAFLQAELRNAA